MRDRVTFVHAADLHLDAPFAGIAVGDPRVGRALAEATYEAWRAVVDLAIERQVDFVLVAGDAYNAGERSPRARYRFREQLLRLESAGIRALIVHGNHDPLSASAAPSDLPATAHVFPAAHVERFLAADDDGFVCAVYGRSFGKKAETEDFTPGYRRDPSDTVSIGLLHANVGSDPDYDPYAPCTLGSLVSCGMDYWALGHIHKFEVLSKDPWVVYAGSPQGLNPKETGEHGCCVVEVGPSGITSFEHVALPGVSWHHVTVDVTDVGSVEDVHCAMSDACDEVRSAAPGPAVVRLELVGRTPAHRELSAQATFDSLVGDVRLEEAAAEPWVWLDKVTDRTRPSIDVDGVRQGGTFASQLVRIADELLADPAQAEALVAELSAPITDKLKDYWPGTSPTEAVEQARDRCLDLLLSNGD